MSTESYIGQQFKVNRKSFTVERIIAEGEATLTMHSVCDWCSSADFTVVYSHLCLE